jgi:peptidyl-prolyl cis-trans isomerase D
MFDLFRSRDKAVRYLLGALLGLVALSLVITLIPGFGAPSGAPEQVVAEVGGEIITVRQVSTAIQNAMRGRQVPNEMLQFYVPQMIDQMISERAVAFQAARMGYKVSDEELALAIRSMLVNYLGAGEIRREDYARFLSQQNLTIDEFERNVRTQMLLLRLLNVVQEGTIITPDEVEREYRRKNDKAKVEYVAYTPKDLRSQVTVTPDEIRNYYNSQKNSFVEPEKRAFTLLVADEEKIAATLPMNEEALKTAYNRNIEKFRTPDRARVRHILIKTTEKPADQIPALQAKAQDILKQLRGGADFAELATKNSEDPGSAVKGGDLDWVVRGQTVPEFEKAAFSLQPKQISDVIKTEYGFHILQVLEKEAARVKPFEEVKTQLGADMKREAVYERMQQVSDQARAELARNPKGAADIAAKYGLTVANVERAGQGDPMPEVGANPELSGALFTGKPGEVTAVVQVAQSKLAFGVVNQVFPSRPSELAEVENQVRETLMTTKAQQFGEQKAKEAIETLRRAGGDLKTAAKAVGSEVKTTDYFTMEGSAEGIGPASYLAEAFTKPAGTVVGPFAIGSQVFLARVVDKQPADMSKLPAEREKIVLGLKQRKAGERRELFEDGLVAQLLKEGKIKKYQDNINRIVQNYRG